MSEAKTRLTPQELLPLLRKANVEPLLRVAVATLADRADAGVAALELDEAEADAIEAVGKAIVRPDKEEV